MIKSYILIIIIILSFSIIPAYSKTNFWNKQKKGANIFNKQILQKDIQAAKKYNIKFIRLSPDKFISTHRDFLLGNADNYKKLVKKDLNKLKNILNLFQKEKMPVIITMLSLPGSRWKQNNNNQDDLRIWESKKYQSQTIKFWEDMTKELANHPSVVGFNLLNEPHPEKLYKKKSINIQKVNEIKIQNMLFNFYNKIIKAIRKINPNITIILDSSKYADPTTFKHLKVHKEKNILYSFHMYEPYSYTNKKINKGKFTYPGKVNSIFWNYNTLNNYMQEVRKFQKRNNIKSNRILVGEYGGNRASKGIKKYFNDLIKIFNKNKWHYAFYAFREDVWDGMDYELGTKRVPWSYWKDIENGKIPVINRSSNNPIFKVILKSLKN